MIISGNTIDEITTVKEYLSTCFKMKDLSQLKYFLGIEVSGNSTWFYLSQRKYALDIISDTENLGAKPITFPLEKNNKLAISESPLLVNAEPYHRLIGRLIYLDVTGPDLSYSIHVLAQFMQVPREDHWTAAIRIVRYLKNSPGKGILLHVDADFRIVGWCDSDWASCPITRRSVTCYFVQISKSPISWKTKKQQTMRLSYAEAEYHDMAFLTKELIWLKKYFMILVCLILFQCLFIVIVNLLFTSPQTRYSTK